MSSAVSFELVNTHLDKECRCCLDDLGKWPCVILLPCEHKVHRLCALRWYGALLSETNKLRAPKNCLVCQVEATSYKQEVLKRVFQQAVLPTSDSYPVERGVYPGKKTAFTPLPGEWNTIRIGQSVTRRMQFQTKDRDAFISYFAILGLKNRQISLGFIYNESDVGRRYLTDNGISLKRTARVYHETVSYQELQAAYRILEQNNTIPQLYRDAIKAIVLAGLW